MAANLESIVSRLEAVASKLESVQLGGGSGGGGAVSDEDPIWLDDFNKIYAETWKKFLTDTAAIGGDLAKQGELVSKAFEAHNDILKIAAQNGQPAQSDLQKVLKPLADAIGAVQKFREDNRPSAQINFLSCVSEAIPFLGWIAVAPKPAAYVVQMVESAQFYTNKILKEFRQSEPAKADWSNSLMKLMKDFQQYIKDNHVTGLQWNKEKPAATGATKAGGSSAAPPPPPPPAGGPPPPPPPAPSGKPAVATKPSTDQLFKDINKGGDITKGLRKVTDAEKTHKNPALRSSAAVTATAPRPYSPPQLKKFNSPAPEKPPVFELQNKKWVVENQKDNQSLAIDAIAEQTIYMYKCTNSVLQVKGKLNSITLDNCKKCGVVFEDLISTCEFVNCQSVKAQANGTVPTLSIDKTDGAQIFLTEKSLGTQIITAKSSEMNICISDKDGDLKETPVPEQFITTWDAATKTFKTETMSLNL